MHGQAWAAVSIAAPVAAIDRPIVVGGAALLGCVLLFFDCRCDRGLGAVATPSSEEIRGHKQSRRDGPN